MEFGGWRSERGGGGSGKTEAEADEGEGESISASSSDELPPYDALRASILSL